MAKHAKAPKAAANSCGHMSNSNPTPSGARISKMLFNALRREKAVMRVPPLKMAPVARYGNS